MNTSISRRRRTAALVIGAVALLGSACGSDDAPSTQPTSEPVASIDGMTYLSESVTGRELVGGSVLSLSFDGGSLGADAGCNRMFGDYAVQNGALVVTGLGMTEMACDPALMDQEQWFADFLAGSPALTQDGDRITLATDDVTAVFLDREVADPDRPLEGTAWEVTGTFDAQTASSVPPGGSLQFADGTVQVATGCNTGSGDYELSADGTSVTFGPIMLTRMACVDEETARLERAMIEVLQGTVTVEIDAASMSLDHDGTGLQLVARD